MKLAVWLIILHFVEALKVTATIVDEIVDFSPKEIATCKDEKHGQFLRKATKTRFNATFHHLSAFLKTIISSSD